MVDIGARILSLEKFSDIVFKDEKIALDQGGNGKSGGQLSVPERFFHREN